MTQLIALIQLNFRSIYISSLQSSCITMALVKAIQLSKAIQTCSVVKHNLSIRCPQQQQQSQPTEQFVMAQLISSANKT